MEVFGGGCRCGCGCGGMNSLCEPSDAVADQLRCSSLFLLLTSLLLILRKTVLENFNVYHSLILQCLCTCGGTSLVHTRL